MTPLTKKEIDHAKKQLLNEYKLKFSIPAIVSALSMDYSSSKYNLHRPTADYVIGEIVNYLSGYLSTQDKTYFYTALDENDAGGSAMVRHQKNKLRRKNASA